MIVRLYGMLLFLYPRQFREEFGDEMKTAFTDAIIAGTGIKKVLIFLRELFDLPGSIFSIYLQNWFGGNMSSQNKYIVPSTRWQAFI